MIEEVLSTYSFESNLIQEFKDTGFLLKIEKDEYVMSPSNPIKYVPFVIEGLLKVYRNNDVNSRVLLYYLEKGETCSMSITCCLEEKPTSIQVVAEEDSQIWMIPNSNLDKWVTKYASFRRFIFSSYQIRFNELIETIDSLVFTNMEERLIKYLLDTKQATGSFEINKTHQQIADELSTSRVVISRLLKKIETDGRIEQNRNKIEIL